MFFLADTAAEVVQKAAEAVTVPAGGLPQLVTHWPQQADLLGWCQKMGSGPAILLLLAGVVYLLFGFYLFKWLVLLNATVLGVAAGVLIGMKSGPGAALPAGILGGFIAAAVTWPLMKWAVAVMGGAFGALLGASVWNTFGLEPAFAWTGAAMGLIFCGLLCFILFRGSVMMYTSMQGSVMLIFGILGLIYRYQSFAPKLTAGLKMKPYILPLAIFIPTILGMIYQQGNNGAAQGGPKK